MLGDQWQLPDPGARGTGPRAPRERLQEGGVGQLDAGGGRDEEHGAVSH